MKKLSLIIFILSLIIIKPIKAEIYNYGLVINGGFDYDFLAWEQTNCDDFFNFMFDLGSESYEYNIGKYLMLGLDWDEKESIKQTITLPDEAGRIALSFYLNFLSFDYTNQDFFELIVRDAMTGEIYIHEVRHYSDGFTDEWDKVTYNLTKYKGKKIDIIFAGETFSDSAINTHINIGEIQVQVKSPSEFYGYVVNKKQAVKKAKIVVKNPKGKRIWTGKTNNDGIFFIPEINSYKNKRIQIIVKKDGIKKIFKRKTKWAYRYFETFKLN